MIYLKSAGTALFIFILFSGFTGCKNKNNQGRDIQFLSDSSAYHNNSSTDSAKMSKGFLKSPSSSSADHAGRNESTSSGTGTVSNAPTVSTSTQSTKKKEWSKAAQGAVIGGVAGAVGGAIISKKKGTGAAVGAAAGAAGGYIIGRQKDKKDGRVKK